MTLILAACQGGGNYPDKEITFVVPFAAGGPTDLVTRLIAEPMAEELGVEIVVQNVDGAGGTVAAEQVANAEADGYTVLMHHIGMSTAPTLYSDLPYDPLEDFEMIGLVTEVPMTFVGSPEFEPNDMEELIAYVTANLDTVTYANAGIGAASQLCGLLFEVATGLDLTEVPYNGTGPAMDDLLGNQVDFMCDQTTSTTDDILAGDVKPYAVTTAERLDTLPEIPTTEEAGLDLLVTVWHGLYVPAGTPQEVVDALNAALVAALQDEDVGTELTALGAPPVSVDRATPDAHRTLLEEQTELWRPIIEDAGVSAGD
jgi:tripartite-type tricarboxylate transporter receptor subunit TctC